jgi:hypothetical protein
VCWSRFRHYLSLKRPLADLCSRRARENYRDHRRISDHVWRRQCPRKVAGHHHCNGGCGKGRDRRARHLPNCGLDWKSLGKCGGYSLIFSARLRFFGGLPFSFFVQIVVTGRAVCFQTLFIPFFNSCLHCDNFRNLTFEMTPRSSFVFALAILAMLAIPAFSEAVDQAGFTCTCNDPNAAFKVEGDTCECKADFFGTGGLAPCSPCPTGSDSAAGSSICTCEASFYGTNGKAPCLPCPSGSTSAAGSSSCICRDANAVFDQGACKCKAGYYGSGVDPTCTLCPSGSTSAIGSVACTCGTGSTLTPNGAGGFVCQCNANYYGIGGNWPCTKCPDDASSAAGSSTCTVGEGGRCTAGTGTLSCGLCTKNCGSGTEDAVCSKYNQPVSDCTVNNVNPSNCATGFKCCAITKPAGVGLVGGTTCSLPNP